MNNYTRNFITKDAAERFCEDHPYVECIIYKNGDYWAVDVWFS